MQNFLMDIWNRNRDIQHCWESLWHCHSNNLESVWSQSKCHCPSSDLSTLTAPAWPVSHAFAMACMAVPANQLCMLIQ